MPHLARQGGLYVDLADPEVRWSLRRAALDRRTTARQLVGQILRHWLATAGYAVADPGEVHLDGQRETVIETGPPR